MNKKVCSLFVCLMVAGVARAETVVTNAVTKIVRVDDKNSDGSGQRIVKTIEPNRLVGYHKMAGNMHLVYVFKMTGVEKPSHIREVNFCTSQNKAALGFNIDAKVIRISEDATVLESDYETEGVSVMKGFAPQETEGAHSLDDAGQTALAEYLRDNWVEDSYVFISLSSDPLTVPGTENKYAKFDETASMVITTRMKVPVAGIVAGAALVLVFCL